MQTASRAGRLLAASCLWLVLFGPCLVRASAREWKTRSEKHFVIHYAGADSFAREVGRSAEQYYDAITLSLGISRRAEFWLWEERARIYIYPSHAEFVASGNIPAWAGAKADYVRREIHTFEGSPDFLQTLLPHELTHLVFRDFMGTGTNIPLWLEEGVAQWAERAGRARRESSALVLLRQGRLLPLEQLMRTDVRHGTRGAEAEAFYIQAWSLVAYLIEAHGPDRFRRLCGQLREGKAFEQALRFTYGDRLDTIGSLETMWRRHLEEKQ